MSIAMARAPTHKLDTEIRAWLREIVLALDLDRVALIKRDPPAGDLVDSYWWARPGIHRLPPTVRWQQGAPWALAEITAGRSIVFSDPEELPGEAGEFKRFEKARGIISLVLMPLQVGNNVVGSLGFNRFRAGRRWSAKELQRLRIVAQIFAGALERKRSDLQARQLREELKVAFRRSTMGELTASIAHELNRPLGAILSNLGGLARLLSQKNLKIELASTAVRSAIEDTERAGEIVRRFRSMFKDEKTSMVAIDIRQLVEDVVAMAAREAASRAINLRIDAPASLPRTMGDPIQIQQCLLNLLMNAFDAMARTRSGSRDVTIAVAPEKPGWIQVSVVDTGAGIDPSVADRIFQPFVTTKTEGMGLGLLVTRSIVEGHGGRIWFTPGASGGSTFTFTLPVEQGGRARA
jgi:signal transduction histidine kinase